MGKFRMHFLRRPGRLLARLFAVVLVSTVAASASAPPYTWKDVPEKYHQRVTRAALLTQPLEEGKAVNFRVLGHHDLGAEDTNGDVWVHGNFAYVGTWSDPCTGGGVKIIDVSDLDNPQLIGRLPGPDGTSSEDVVVRRVSTPHFRGDLAAVGIQRCGEDPGLDDDGFGPQFWDVSDPYNPVLLSYLGVNTGGGGVHELDLFQRGRHVYTLLATPFSEFFDASLGGDFRIIDVTDPNNPVQVGEWGAAAHGLAPGPFYGLGSGAFTFDHSVRASADGTKAYVSYWDLGVLTLDIRDVTNPVLVTRTRFPRGSDGDAHSVSEYHAGGRTFLLQNDEDFDPRSPANIRYGEGKSGLASESPGGAPLWLQPGHKVAAEVIEAENQGCLAADYPTNTAGKIAVVRTPFPFFDPEPGEEPLCLQQEQEAAAIAAGAVAVVHDFIATSTSPQWWDFGDFDVPVLFTDHETAQGMVEAGHAVLRARRPSWGFLRVFDAETGRQVAKFDRLPGVHALPAPDGFWSIHNNEVLGRRSYASWYSNGVVALDLRPLSRREPRNPRLVGQFLPPGAPLVWGVAVRARDRAIFVSDMFSGLWIIRPTGPAAP